MQTTGASTKRPPMSEMMKGVTVTVASSYISIPQVKSEDTVRQLFYFTLDFFALLEAISVHLGKLDSCSTAGLSLIFMGISNFGSTWQPVAKRC